MLHGENSHEQGKVYQVQRKILKKNKKKREFRVKEPIQKSFFRPNSATNLGVNIGNVWCSSLYRNGLYIRTKSVAYIVARVRRQAFSATSSFLLTNDIVLP